MLDEPEAKEDLQEHNEASVIPEECETAEPESFNLILSSWICHMLIKLKLNYNCSNSLFSLIIFAIINFILSIIKHPLHLVFPKTLNDLFCVTKLKIFNQCEIMAVCPNVKCNCIYELSDIVKNGRNGDKISATCPGWVLPYKGLMGTCGQPGYVFREFCLEQGIEFIIFTGLPMANQSENG